MSALIKPNMTLFGRSVEKGNNQHKPPESTRVAYSSSIPDPAESKFMPRLTNFLFKATASTLAVSALGLALFTLFESGKFLWNHKNWKISRIEEEEIAKKVIARENRRTLEEKISEILGDPLKDNK